MMSENESNNNYRDFIEACANYISKYFLSVYIKENKTKINKFIESIVNKPVRDIDKYHEFQCACCKRVYLRTNKAKYNIEIGKTFLNYELCCICSERIENNNCKTLLLSRIQSLKFRLRAITRIQDIHTLIAIYNDYINLRDYLHLH